MNMLPTICGFVITILISYRIASDLSVKLGKTSLTFFFLFSLMSFLFYSVSFYLFFLFLFFFSFFLLYLFFFFSSFLLSFSFPHFLFVFIFCTGKLIFSINVRLFFKNIHAELLSSEPFYFPGSDFWVKIPAIFICLSLCFSLSVSLKFL